MLTSRRNVASLLLTPSSHFARRSSQFIGSLEKGQIPASSLLDPIRKIELIFSGVKYRLVGVRSGDDKFAIYREAGGGEYVEVGIRGLSDGGYLLNVGGSSYVVYILSPEGSPGGFKISVGGQTVAFTPDYDPETLSTDVAGKLVKQLVPAGSHLNKGQAYAEIEVRVCEERSDEALRIPRRLALLSRR